MLQGDLPVEGALPPALDGTYARIGPNAKFPAAGDQHWCGPMPARQAHKVSAQDVLSGSNLHGRLRSEPQARYRCIPALPAAWLSVTRRPRRLLGASGDRGNPRGRFDGDGMVHAVRIKKGKAAYANSWVKTARLKQELRAGRALFPKARPRTLFVCSLACTDDVGSLKVRTGMMSKQTVCIQTWREQCTLRLGSLLVLVQPGTPLGLHSQAS